MKNKFFSFLRITISCGLLGLLFWFMRDKIRDIWTTISGCNINFLALGIVFLLTNIVMLAFRLRTVFKGENLDIPFKRTLQLTYIGYYFNNFMPTAVGGDIIKAHYASSADSKGRLRSYTSVFMDRIIGLYTLLIISSIALIIDKGRFQLPQIRDIIYILLLLGILVFIIVTNRKAAGYLDRFFSKFKMFRLDEHLKNLYKIVRDYRNRKAIIIKAVLISMMAQYLYFVTVYLFFLALDVRINLGNIFLIMPVVTFISMVPSIGGLGVREGAIVVFFGSLGGRETAFAVSLLLLFGLFFISIIGGIIYLWWGIKAGAKARSRQIVKSIEDKLVNNSL